ncbi:methyl-accepting chemotaxis protein [Vibrio vulnificus]|nr:methyl-accepting chemotaxis protein [Vibrio vulnificus]
MNNLSIKFKILLIAFFPMIVSTLVILGLVAYFQQSALVTEIKDYKQTLTAERQNNIRDAALVATAVVEDVVSRLGTGEDAKLAIKHALSHARFAENDAGYFFVFDENGDYLVHSLNPKLEGSSGIDLTDPNGIKITQALKTQANQGGGFIEYVYAKPGGPSPQPKISFASPVSNSPGWFIGTGLYVDDIDRATTLYQTQSEVRTNEQFTVILMICSVMFLMVAGGVVLVSNVITKPILFMLDNFNKVASGEGDLTYRMNPQGKDEIAQLGSAFDRFIETLHGMMSDVHGVTLQVTHAASAIKNQTEVLQEQLHIHDNETEQVVTSITEMSSTAQEVAMNANEVARATELANKDSQNALHLVDVSTGAISLLENNIHKGGESMVSLQEQSRKIDGVLQVISDIAEQTNLLALNAAIEAARAGEQGRGFAVVADEVRNLAGRTQNSTIEIKQMLDGLHMYVQSAVVSMKESDDSCGSVVQSSSSIVSGLMGICDSVKVINEMTEQIAAASTEQSVVTDEVNKNLVSIREIVQRLLEANKESNHVAVELSESGNKLNQLIGQFKI